MSPSLKTRMLASGAQATFGLPTPVRRAITGRPVRLDGQRLALDAQLLLWLQRLTGTGLVNGGVARSRAALEENRHLVSGRTIEPVDVRELAIPNVDRTIAATLYRPKDLAEPSGLLVFFHGGGWVIGSRISHDNQARYLAVHAGVRVLSVDYRLAPEAVFPAAVEDALAAFHFASEHAADLGADPARIAVGGDSAGGNLAAVVAHQTSLTDGPVPAFQLLIYPAVDGTVRRRSRDLFGNGFFLTDPDMTWFLDLYAPEGVDRADPRLSPLLAEDLANVAPAYIATAGFDPLRDEGEAYAAKLRSLGVPVALSRQSDLIHGYLSFIGIGHRFAEAASEAAGALRFGLTH